MRVLYPLYAHFRLNLNRTSIMAEENITTKVQQTYGISFCKFKVILFGVNEDEKLCAWYPQTASGTYSSL